MAITKSNKIWMNGKWVPWDDAKIHVLSHVRALRVQRVRGHPLLRHAARPAIFRLDEHVDRLDVSRRASTAWSCRSRASRSAQACLDVVAVNDLEALLSAAAHLPRLREPRRQSRSARRSRSRSAAFPWGKYLGDDALTKGVAVKISCVVAHRAQHAAGDGQGVRPTT